MILRIKKNYLTEYINISELMNEKKFRNKYFNNYYFIMNYIIRAYNRMPIRIFKVNDDTWKRNV